ncbi:hypothetical protein [Nannocystis pusilla]|uniref:hypothetical protein n=1 Tax=Nannocystis pusilla TaxID=889268 RepID=UPI003B80B4D1
MDAHRPCPRRRVPGRPPVQLRVAPSPHLRLGFAGLDERGLAEAIRRMALALTDLRKQ